MGGYLRVWVQIPALLGNIWPQIDENDKYSQHFIPLIAEVPSAARVNLQPAEYLKNVSFSF